jgi:hypothetical protein
MAGVTVPHCGPIPLAVSSARNSVAGSELWLMTVTVHLRPPGTTNDVGAGPADAAGVAAGVGRGVALGTATAT